MEDLRVCLASSEVVPFAKTGGLGDVSGALGKYLKKKGVDIRVFMPFYDIVDPSDQILHEVEFIRHVPIHFEGYSLSFSLLTTKLPGTEVDMYFIHCPQLYYRGSVYTGEGDEYLRFAFFTRAVIESCQRMGWGPHIFHCNDWQTALLPLYLRTVYKWDDLFRHTRTVLTIHNIGYQGVFGADVVRRIGLSSYRDKFHQEDLSQGRVNFLKTGLLYADAMTTVSRTYAQEIQTSEYGAGLDYYLRMRSHRLVGIVNGVDYEEWSPQKDSFIPHHYSPEDMSGKEKNKKALLERLGLPFDPQVPLFGIVSRLTYQKGFEILMEILFPFLAHNNVQFAILGSGEYKYEDFFSAAQSHFPQKVCFYRGYNNPLAHFIEAGADAFVMPSRYEPCGLNQIYSLKYGTVPIVRQTGGLADTVDLWNPETEEGTGFIFEHFTADALSWALGYALQTWKHQEAWQKLRQNGMARDYSWENQSQKYVDLYENLL